MIKVKDFYIDALELKDAKSLSNLLLSNAKRFQRYFPKTLAENKSLEETKEYILNKGKLVETKGEYTLGLKDAKSKEIAGLVIIKNINREKQDAEVAYCIGANFGGKGWMTKAVNAIIPLAFEDLGLNSLYILAHKTNIPSVRVAEKTGFIWAKIVINGHTPPNEEPLDMEYFELKK